MKNRYVLLFFGIIASITLVNLSLGAEVNESDIKSLINMILNPEKPDFISASNILWFGGAILLLISILSWKLKWDADHIIRLFGLTTIVTMLIFVSVIDIAKESLTALIGILGTYGGYLAGNAQGRQQQQDYVAPLKLLDDMRSANKITKEEYESAKAILSKL